MIDLSTFLIISITISVIVGFLVSKFIVKRTPEPNMGDYAEAAMLGIITLMGTYFVVCAGTLLLVKSPVAFIVTIVVLVTVGIFAVKTVNVVKQIREQENKPKQINS